MENEIFMEVYGSINFVFGATTTQTKAHRTKKKKRSLQQKALPGK
jgi:hypothetical protein